MGRSKGERAIVFINREPKDKEWSAHVNLLNKYTTPDRYLRHIIQYARSGPHYPADMHVDLIEQLIATRPKKTFEVAMRDIHGYSVHHALTLDSTTVLRNGDSEVTIRPEGSTEIKER